MEQLKCFDVSLNENFIVIAYKKQGDNSTNLAIFEIISERLLACSLITSEFNNFFVYFIFIKYSINIMVVIERKLLILDINS